MLVEMASSDKMEENIESPVGTNGYAGLIFVCLLIARLRTNEKLLKFVGQDREEDLDVLPLGGMAGEKTIENLLRTCGFTKFRCALRDGFRWGLEAKP